MAIYRIKCLRIGSFIFYVREKILKKATLAALPSTFPQGVEEGRIIGGGAHSVTVEGKKWKVRKYLNGYPELSE